MFPPRPPFFFQYWSMQDEDWRSSNATQQLLDDIQQDMYGHTIAPISLQTSSSSSSSSNSRESSYSRDHQSDSSEKLDHVHVAGEGQACITYGSEGTLLPLRAGDASHVVRVPSIGSSDGASPSCVAQPSSSSSGSRVVCTPEGQLVVKATQLPTSMVFTPSSSNSASSSRLSNVSGAATQCSSSPSPAAVTHHAIPLPSSTSQCASTARGRKRVRVVSPTRSDTVDNKVLLQHGENGGVSTTTTTTADITSAASARPSSWCPLGMGLSQIDYNAGAGSSSSSDDEDDENVRRSNQGSVGSAASTGALCAFYDVHPASIRYYLPLRESRVVPSATLPMAALVSLRAVDAMHRFDVAMLQTLKLHQPSVL
jgi:hypothetical protein